MPASSFAYGGSLFDIITPWFYLAIALHYPMVLHQAIATFRFSVSFKPNKNIKEGDYYFKNNYDWVLGVRGMREYYQQIPRDY